MGRVLLGMMLLQATVCCHVLVIWPQAPHYTPAHKQHAEPRAQQPFLNGAHAPGPHHQHRVCVRESVCECVLCCVVLCLSGFALFPNLCFVLGRGLQKGRETWAFLPHPLVPLVLHQIQRLVFTRQEEDEEAA